MSCNIVHHLGAVGVLRNAGRVREEMTNRDAIARVLSITGQIVSDFGLQTEFARLLTSRISLFLSFL